MSLTLSTLFTQRIVVIPALSHEQVIVSLPQAELNQLPNRCLFIKFYLSIYSK